MINTHAEKSCQFLLASFQGQHHYFRLHANYIEILYFILSSIVKRYFSFALISLFLSRHEHFIIILGDIHLQIIIAQRISNFSSFGQYAWGRVSILRRGHKRTHYWYYRWFSRFYAILVGHGVYRVYLWHGYALLPNMSSFSHILVKFYQGNRPFPEFSPSLIRRHIRYY